MLLRKNFILLLKVILMMSFLCGFISVSFAKSFSPVGEWLQISDVTNKPHSVIQIYHGRHGKLYGKIAKGFSDDGKPLKEYCSLCPGKLKNKPMRGLVILNDFEQVSSNVWGNGTILDPDTGKIYKCKLTLTPDGKQLSVRGYIGVSLFGRTHIWERKK